VIWWQLAALQAENAKLRPFGIPLPFHGMEAYSPLAVRPGPNERLSFPTLQGETPTRVPVNHQPSTLHPTPYTLNTQL